MNIHTYIDYIDDPNDTYEQYLEKAKKYHFRCIFAQIDTYDAVSYTHLAQNDKSAKS